MDQKIVVFPLTLKATGGRVPDKTHNDNWVMYKRTLSSRMGHLKKLKSAVEKARLDPENTGSEKNTKTLVFVSGQIDNFLDLVVDEIDYHNKISDVYFNHGLDVSMVSSFKELEKRLVLLKLIWFALLIRVPGTEDSIKILNEKT